MTPAAKRCAWAVTALVVAAGGGCLSTRYPAPVSERAPEVVRPAAKPVPPVAAPTGDPRPEFYVVKKGDTLYTIALDHGLDYKDLADWNAIDNPNRIRVGQQLRLRAPPSTVVATPLPSAPAVEGKPIGTAPPPVVAREGVKTEPKAVKVPYSDQALAQLTAQPLPKPPAPAVVKLEPRPEEKPAVREDDDEKVDWGWPAGGKLLASFNESTNSKGIDIAGKLGQAVVASASGKVIYSGEGIRGYGKFIVIKHNKSFLSVYTHNNQLLVKYGDSVVKGQKIADMGASDTDQVKLHFEIRHFGKPIDPLKLLPPAGPV